ncbi:hypothetical protein C8039_03455 [Halogeometricum sp. wsp3]|nr:hypothetical protein C8039_03455 [Halogeometricum sp. wsp3]
MTTVRARGHRPDRAPALPDTHADANRAREAAADVYQYRRRRRCRITDARYRTPTLVMGRPRRDGANRRRASSSLRRCRRMTTAVTRYATSDMRVEDAEVEAPSTRTGPESSSTLRRTCSSALAPSTTGRLPRSRRPSSRLT